MNGESMKGEINITTRRANDRRQKTESDRDRGGVRSTYCASYLGLSVLADRIEVFSIYANHSHRRRIITVLCQESSPSAQSLHPLLWRYLALYLSTHHPEIPLYLFLFSFVLFSFRPWFSPFSLFFPSISILLSPSVLSMSTLEDTLFCKSNKTARVLHLMDAHTHLHTHSDRLNAG